MKAKAYTTNSKLYSAFQIYNACREFRDNKKSLRIAEDAAKSKHSFLNVLQTFQKTQEPKMLYNTVSAFSKSKKVK